MKLLKQCTNIFGTLDQHYQAEILKYFDQPTIEQWHNIFPIIIKGDTWLTVWQAVLEIDLTFPRRGRVTDDDGTIIREWERIPDTFTLYRAIKYATKK